MLTFAIGLVVLQSKIKPVMGRELPLSALGKKLEAAAKQRGWSRLHDRTFPQGNVSKVDPNFVLSRYAYGNHVFSFNVEVAKSLTEAKRELRMALRSNAMSPRTKIEEPLLKGTGLQLDVTDFSNKRISNMKAYSTMSMRITGAIKRAVVIIYVDMPSAVPVSNDKPKPDEQIYDDVVALAKFVAKEIKKS